MAGMDNHFTAVAWGSMGGHARWKDSTPEERKAQARKAAMARWHPAEVSSDDTAYTPAELCEALAGCLPAHLRPYWQPRLSELLSTLR